MENELTLKTTGTCKIVAPPISIQINSTLNGELLGKFYEKEGSLTFEGKTDEAAKVFVDFIIKSFNGRIQDLINQK